MAGGEISISIDGTAIGKIQKVFRFSKKQAPVVANRTSRAMAKDLVKIVKENASGRPGPKVETGEYRASIRTFESESEGSSFTTFAGTDAPQARRLEFGYVGVDSIGRHYHQPPYPHWRPGMQTLADKKKRYFLMLREALPK